MIFKARFVSRQNVIRLFHISDIDFRDFKAYACCSRSNDKLEIFHRNAVVIAEHFVNNLKRLCKRVFVLNSAVYNTVVEFQTYDTSERCAKLVILELFHTIGRHKVLMSVLEEAVQKLVSALVST